MGYRLFHRKKTERIDEPDKLKDIVREMIMSEKSKSSMEKERDYGSSVLKVELANMIKETIKTELLKMKSEEKKHEHVETITTSAEGTVTILEKEIVLDEEEKHIKSLEERLKKKRAALQRALEYKEKELEMIRKMLDNERKMLIKKDDELTIREQELKKKEEECNKKLETINIARKELDEQMKLLKELEMKLEVWKGDREKIIKNIIEKEGREKIELDEDIKKLLPVLDSLLGELPDLATDKFTKTDDYKLYLKVLEKYGVS